MNIFKKFFSKSSKTSDSFYDETQNYESNFDYSKLGDTVILNENISQVRGNNDKTVLLHNDYELQYNIVEFDTNPDTLAKGFLDEEFLQQGYNILPVDDERINLEEASVDNNDDTVILTQNDKNFHFGDTVVLKRNNPSESSEIPINFYIISPTTGLKKSISKREFKIGSDLEIVDLLCEGIGVSRHHATIFVENAGCFIVDNGSTNGTEVEGILLEPFKRYKLENGVLLMFANDVYQFYIEQ